MMELRILLLRNNAGRKKEKCLEKAKKELRGEIEETMRTWHIFVSNRDRKQIAKHVEYYPEERISLFAIYGHYFSGNLVYWVQVFSMLTSCVRSNFFRKL